MSRTSAPAEFVAALELAFPGVKIKQFDLLPPDHSDDVLGVEICAFGAASDLVAAGLVTQQQIDAVPPCGDKFPRDPGVRRIQRQKKGYRIDFWYYDDIWPDRESAQSPIESRLAQVLTPAIWQPPATESAT